MKIDPALLGEVSSESGEDFGAFVDELRSPRDEVLETHGHGDLALYERLLRDGQVKSTFSQRRDSVIGREVKVDPGGDAPIDQQAADFLREQIARVSFDRASYKMLAGLMYGYGVSECLFGLEAGRVVLRGIRVRRAARFRFGTDGRLRLLRAGDNIVMPERKFWTYSAGAEDDDDPYGRGLGYWLYWPVWFKRNVLRFWSLFLETFSSPTPKATVPAGTTEADRQRFLGYLDAVTNGGKIVVPRGVEVELVQAAKDSGGDYERFINLVNADISKIVLTQTMTTDDGASLAQGKVHLSVHEMRAKTDSDLLTESFASGPGRWLTEWNFPGAKTPVVYRDFGVAEDLKALADRDAVLNGMGYRPTPERVRETYGEGYERAPVTAPAVPAFAERSSASDAVESLLDDGGWERVIGDDVEFLDQLVGRARSLEQVRDRLGALAKRDPTKLSDALARVMFAARAGGNAEYEADTEESA